MNLGDVFGTENRILLVCWSAAIIIVLIFGFLLGQQPVVIMGFTDSREQLINFEVPVEVRQIHVLPGQKVKRGTLLLELGQPDLEEQLRTLKSRYGRLSAELNLRQDLAKILQDRTKLSESSDPLTVELAGVDREIKLIKNRLRKFSVYSEFAGTVGGVNFKKGEKAPAFASLLTLLPLAPTLVKAYINENLTTSFKVGQRVEVGSATGASIEGRILSMGNRIVPMPERLLRIPTLAAWGREVVVEIPAKNTFLPGEKVSIEKPWNLTLFAGARAEEAKQGFIEDLSKLREVTFVSGLSEKYEMNLSGLSYNEDLKKFIIASNDEGVDEGRIFLMDRDGRIKNAPILIQGAGKMKRIESISSRKNEIFLVSSLEEVKPDSSNLPFQQLLYIRQEKDKFTLLNKMNLTDPLLEAMSNSSSALLRDIAETQRTSGISHFSIEGHFIKDRDLFLLIGSSLVAANNVVLIQVSDFEQYYRGKSARKKRINLKSVFVFNPPRHEELVVTDIVEDQGELYFATSCQSSSCSMLWHSSNNKPPELIQEFGFSQFKSISIDRKTKEIFAIFDVGGQSKFVIIPMSRILNRL